MSGDEVLNELGDGELRDSDLRHWSSAHPFPIWVASPPALDRSEMVWRSDAGVIGIRPRYPSESLLEQFVALVAAPDSTIVEFAAEWGWLDPGELARADEFLLRPEYVPPAGKSLPFVGDWANNEHREPIADWRKRSGEARALVSIAAALHSNELGRVEDWRLLYPAFADQRSIWDRVGGFSLPPGLLAEERILARIRVRDFINRWLFVADVRPRLVIAHAETVSVALGGHGLLGALGVQMLFAACRTQGLETCSNCGSGFLPKRRPTPGRRRYCRLQACQRARTRDATRAHARRRADAWRLFVGGASVAEIARQVNRKPKVVRGWIQRQRQLGNRLKSNRNPLGEP